MHLHLDKGGKHLAGPKGEEGGAWMHTTCLCSSSACPLSIMCRNHSLPLTAPQNTPTTTTEATAAIRGHVVDVLTYCVRAHGYRMRYFVILNNLAQKASKRPSKPLTVHVFVSRRFRARALVCACPPLSVLTAFFTLIPHACACVCFVVEQVLRLTHAREKHLRLAAVRFLRAIVSTKDEFYNRHLVSQCVCRQ